MSRELPILFNTEMVRAILDGRKTATRRLVKFLPRKNPNWTGYVKNGLMLYNGRNEPCIKKAPYQPGDILYVRETFIQAAAHTFWYKADDKSWMSKDLLWKPSIHMPKEAARIWLKVTDVKVERLQEITAESALAEGADKYIHTNGELDENMTITSFIGIWNSTIKKSNLDCCGWNANPWIWIIEFERCQESVRDKCENEKKTC